MSSWRKSRVRRVVAGLVILACAGALILTGALAGLPGTTRALGQSPAPEVTAQTDAAVPAHTVVMLGSSPQETAGETWGVGTVGAQSAAKWALVHYTPAAGWTLAPPFSEEGGSALSGFQPADGNFPGSITPDGSGALLGQVPVEGHEPRELLLMRSPGQETFSEAASEPAEKPPLEAGEELFDPTGRRAAMVAALEEPGGSAGALVVPVVTESSQEEASVLHWSGDTHSWSAERIEATQKSLENGFRVLAIAASPADEGAPGEAWLLAQLEAQSETLALFHRQESGGSEVWQPVAISGGEPGAPLNVPLAEGQSTQYTLPGLGSKPSNQSQLLTASARGVWIDGERADDRQRATMFFKPEGENSGTVLASWCGAVSDTPCEHTIAGGLPNGESRSFAWAGSSTYGERVITGLNEGVSLRLEGETFQRVLALGSAATYDVGGSHGAAFSSPTEGWLGSERFPVRLTVSPEENLLQNYPVPFRHPLLAIASQPGAPAGALASEAVAVGEEGEVARYKQGIGWQPESLLNIAGVRQTPHLRAVAWPTPNRVYAVGTNAEGNEGQIWLWRGETDLWEKDPATPINFRGKLLGIAFDPEDASRGYAVGQGGVLLRYGKTWTQEPTCQEGVSGNCLPAEVAGASFTSIAFAGSETIVAYRVPHFTYKESQSTFSYTGGLLVNNGSGWQVDAGAASALAVEAQDIPWAVAALPDGGAAMSAESGAGVPHVFERNSAQGPWEATAEPYPGYHAPGALAIFREEGGALRVIGSGAIPNTSHEDEQTEAPAGFPPPLVKRYPLAEPPVFLFRQTSSGWSEEEHDHDEVGPPAGEYKLYDKGYEPDPAWAVLVSATGREGWSVGGFPRGESEAGYETSDIARYAFPHAESTAPPGVASSPVPVEPGKALFAIGGNAQCGGPCAARANARIGPDVWLSSALKRANAIGVRDFLYTGPRLTTGQTLVKPILEIPYEEEFTRYAQLLAGGGGTPVYAAASATDYVNGGECLFEQTFAQFFETAKGQCGSGHDAYYAVPPPISASAGGKVRTLVLDDVGGIVGPAQLEWLKAELSGAASAGEPAIVVGNADLNDEEEHHEGEAAAVVRAMVNGSAAAYFFDAPEQNLELHLRGSKIPAFGSGTLGYVNVQNAEEPEFIGASGFLMVEVGAYEAKPEAGAGHAKVEAQLIPVIGEGEHGEGELALEAQQGTLLRRSQVAMFSGLARRPRAGNEGSGESESESLSYVFTPIPANCVGAVCPPNGPGLLPKYSFTSSNEEVGRFVKQELHSSEPDAVQFNSKEEPIFEEGKRNAKGLVESASGLFCALNKGETEVTISTGGLSATLKVTVEAGSVRRPCGTVPAKHPAAQEQQVSAPPPPPVSPTPTTAPTSAPLLPLPPAPIAAPAPPVRPPVHTPPPPFFIQPALPALLVPFLPPPLVEPANPTPPSGTSAVTSPVEAAQKEEEHEEATESVSNQAVAYRAHEHEPSPAYLLGIVLLAAFAGASAFRRPGRGRRAVRVAPATISTSYSQRQLEDRRSRR